MKDTARYFLMASEPDKAGTHSWFRYSGVPHSEYNTAELEMLDNVDFVNGVAISKVPYRVFRIDRIDTTVACTMEDLSRGKQADTIEKIAKRLEFSMETPFPVSYYHMAKDIAIDLELIPPNEK